MSTLKANILTQKSFRRMLHKKLKVEMSGNIAYVCSSYLLHVWYIHEMDNESKPHKSWLFQQLAVNHTRKVKTLWPVPSRIFSVFVAVVTENFSARCWKDSNCSVIRGGLKFPCRRRESWWCCCCCWKQWQGVHHTKVVCLPFPVGDSMWRNNLGFHILHCC